LQNGRVLIADGRLALLNAVRWFWLSPALLTPVR
jgi:hypothetical protein